MATIEERKGKDGKPQFRAKVRMRGYPPASATFSRRTDANRWVQKVETEMREGRYFNLRAAQRHTLAEAIDRYFEYTEKSNPRRLKDLRTPLLWWKKKLGAYCLLDISRSMVSDARDGLMKESFTRGKKQITLSNATINRRVGILETLYNHAINDWEWAQTNPVATLSDLKEPPGRNRYLSDDERERLLASCKESENPYLYTIVVLGMSSGARKNEINCIRWENVHLKEQFIVIPKTKNRQSRCIYLHAEALVQLQKLAVESDYPNNGYIFPSKLNPSRPLCFTRAWNTALRCSKIQDFRFHDLRHTAASYLSMSGANIKDIADILGHKSLAMTHRYAHLSKSHMASVVESMNGRIFNKSSELAK